MLHRTQRDWITVAWVLLLNETRAPSLYHTRYKHNASALLGFAVTLVEWRRTR